MTEKTSNIQETEQTTGAPELSGSDELSLAEMEQVAGGGKGTRNTTSGTTPNTTLAG